jgi:hypothetical protein
MRLHRRGVLTGLAATALGLAFPALPARGLPRRACRSGQIFRRNDCRDWPPQVLEFMLGSRWHIHQTEQLGRAIRQVDTGLTFIDAKLPYDPFALELLRHYDQKRELADCWDTMAVAWAAVVIAGDVSRCLPWRADSMQLWFPGCDDSDRNNAFYEDAPPLIAETLRGDEIWIYNS